ncbi:hypothetical protein OAB09_04555 [Pelagibacteraceae bacterium]|nr:hypothetical protein [Pelagibacteraceae bacterium]
MKKLLVILVMSLFLITPSQTNDISDFQIEGMSVGDSALDYFSKKEIEVAFSIVKSSYNSDKFKRALFRSSNFEIYDAIMIHSKKIDKTYKIYSLSSVLKFPKDFKSCNTKKKEIVSDFKNMFVDYKITQFENRKIKQDKEGQSFVNNTSFNFNDGSSARVMCYDWSNEAEQKSFIDHLRVALSSKEFNIWIENEAYK